MVLMFLLSIGAAVAKEPKTNLDRLSEKKRTEYLLDVSKEAIMKYAPGWYREEGGYKIERLTWEGEVNIKQRGKASYIVKRYYDDSKEMFPKGFSTETFINEETGTVSNMRFGDGGGVGDLDNPAYENDPFLKKWTPGQYDIKK